MSAFAYFVAPLDALELLDQSMAGSGMRCPSQFWLTNEGWATDGLPLLSTPPRGNDSHSMTPSIAALLCLVRHSIVETNGPSITEMKSWNATQLAWIPKLASRRRQVVTASSCHIMLPPP